jgi:VWFA-related protein
MSQATIREAGPFGRLARKGGRRGRAPYPAPRFAGGPMKTYMLPAIAFLALSAGTLAQEPPTFRSRVDLVRLSVLVLDAGRRPVEGLKVRDFTLLEDGKPREVQVFSAISMPQPTDANAAAWVRDGVVDVASNQHAPEGRLVVVMMDRSILAGPQTIAARAIARAVVDSLAPGDLAAVVRNSGYRSDGKVHGFTGDKARLRAVIESPFTGFVVPPQMTSTGLQATLPDLASTPDCLCGVCVMDSLTHVANALAAMPDRQKLIVFVGSDILIEDSASPVGNNRCSGQIADGRTRAFSALARSNVLVYSADPTGLETLARGFDVTNLSPRTPTTTLRRQGRLGVLPSFTGGRAIVNSNSPEALVTSIFDETRSYYLLGFTSARTDGKQSEIRVRVNRPGVTVRARRGAFGDAGPGGRGSVSWNSASVIEDTIAAPFPRADVPLSTLVTPAYRGDGAAQLVAQVDLSSLGSEAQSAGVPADVIVGVFDIRGNPVASQQHSLVVPAARPGDPPPVARADFTIRPGSYEVRVGVRRRADGREGSVYSYVDVFEPSDHGVALSGIILSDSLLEPSAAGPSASVPAPLIQRTFTRAQPLVATVQVKKGRQAATPVSVRTDVIDDRDRGVSTLVRDVAASGFLPAAVSSVRFDVPTATLAPGRYLLKVEATSGPERAMRQIPFEVR